MAITARAAGTWAVSTAATLQVSIPAGATTGDMMLLLFSLKCANPPAVPTIDQSWTVLTPYTNGTTASGNGSGSNTTGMAYKQHTGSETDPTLTWDSGGDSASPGVAVIVAFQKAAGDSWVTPTGSGGGITSTSSSYSATNSDPGVTAGDMCVAVLGSRDDTAWTVPTFSQTSATFATATVYPTTPIASATGNDISATAVYRGVNSGTGSGNVTVTGTLAAVETGSHFFVRLRAAAITNASAGVASATAAAETSADSLGPAPAVTSATATAGAPTVTAGKNADAGLASAAAAAGAATGSLSPAAGYAAAAAAAGSPTITAFAVTNASAGVASAVAAAEWTSGGSSTVGSDTFTESSTVALTSHTAETGGTWSVWRYDGMELYVDGAGDYAYTANPDDATWHTNISKLGSVAVGDGYVQARVTLNATSGGVVARTVGTNNAYVAVEDNVVLGKLLRITAGAFTQLATGPAVASPRTVKLDVSGSSPTTLRVRAWDVTEGGTWDIDTSDNTAGNQAASGGVGILANGYNDSYGSGDQPTYIDSFSAITSVGR